MPAAAQGWQRSASLGEWLRAEPYKFEFYQAVRLLEGFRPLALLPGETQQPAHEAVRFQSAVDFRFPASEVQSLEWTNGTPRMTVNFFGLAGALGPLPQTYTEMVLDAAAKKDRAGIDFLDIFNNRLLMLLYRARKAQQAALTARSPDQSDSARHLFAFVGLAAPALRHNLNFPARALLQYCGLFARPVRTAAGLEVLLADFFGVPVRIGQFFGIWRDIDRSQWSTLGRSGQNNALGTQTALGTRVWDQSGCVVIAAGPLNLAEFSSFLPGTNKHRLLLSMVEFYLGIGLRARVRLTLRRAVVPPSLVGQSRLGLTSWLLAKPGAKVDQQVRFHLTR